MADSDIRQLLAIARMRYRAAADLLAASLSRYRPFDPAGTARAFPQFRYTSLADGLAATHRQYLERPA